ncbi:neprilysin-like 16 isoform X2 [Arctopsyche grandis]|uniref:neprilysin-like 16 isoform X2 n=1 Tax=Arctopsyche grandis TaxID=121162 RepID=UPI00406D9FD5
MPCYWLRTNSSVHKASLTVVTLLVTSLLVASPVLFLISSVPANEQPYRDCTIVVSTSNRKEEEDCFAEKNLDAPISICDTSECKDIARRIQFSISWDHDPCRDFYKFACGGWSESHKTRNRRLRPAFGMDLSFTSIQTNVHLQIQQLLSMNATSGRFKKLGKFYSSCLMSFNKPVDMSPMYMVLDKLGGYLPPGSLGPNDVTSLIVGIIKANGAPLIDIYLDRDVHNKSAYSIVVDLPRDTTSHRSFYSNAFDPSNSFYSRYKVKNFKGSRRRRDIHKESIYYTYLKGKRRETKLFGLERVVAGMLPKGISAREKANDIQQILLFATTAEQLQPRAKELKEHLFDPANTKPYTIEMLQESFPFLTWKNLFRDLLTEENMKNKKIYVISRQYLQSVSDMISRFQKRVIQNALLAMFARDFLYVISNHTEASDEKYQFCTHVTTKAFPPAVAALYLTQYTKNYLDDLHTKAAEMFLQLKRALFGRVEKVTWLDSETKWKTMEKLSAMTAHFIAWPSLRNRTYVDEMLTTLNITDDFFENIIWRYHELKETQMGMQDSQLVNLSWPYPFVVNAFYETDDNSIVVPLALLTQPHFSRAMPEYISYGTIGNIIAHEMLHALDYSTVPYTPGPLWEKSSSLPALQNRLTCLANQYQAATRRNFKFMAHDMEVEFDGNATREENAADIGGARVSWVAWRGVINSVGGGATLPPLPLTPAKLFYVTMAQLYCTDLSTEDYVMAVEDDFHMTAPERVNGVVRNSPAFAEVYECSTGSPMNPSNKCIIW